MIVKKARAAIRKVDVDSMARMHIFADLVCNFDAFKKSSYFYVDLSEDGTGKLTFACPWDYNWTFVIFNTTEFVPTDQYFTAERSVFYVMMMNHEWFRAMVGDVWEEVAANSRHFRNTVQMMIRISDVYATDFQEDSQMCERKNAQKPFAMKTYEWLLARIDWLDVQFTAMKHE